MIFVSKFQVRCMNKTAARNMRGKDESGYLNVPATRALKPGHVRMIETAQLGGALAGQAKVGADVPHNSTLESSVLYVAKNALVRLSRGSTAARACGLARCECDQAWTRSQK